MDVRQFGYAEKMVLESLDLGGISEVPSGIRQGFEFIHPFGTVVQVALVAPGVLGDVPGLDLLEELRDPSLSLWRTLAVLGQFNPGITSVLGCFEQSLCPCLLAHSVEE